jgi:hypothetical protein
MDGLGEVRPFCQGGEIDATLRSREFVVIWGAEVCMSLLHMPQTAITCPWGWFIELYLHEEPWASASLVQESVVALFD